MQFMSCSHSNWSIYRERIIRKYHVRTGILWLWENGYIESFNGKLRDELLAREVFTTLKEAKVLIEQWRRQYNQVRRHSSLKYQPPAPEAVLTMATS